MKKLLFLLPLLSASTALAQVDLRGFTFMPGPMVHFEGGGENTPTLNEAGDRVACTFTPEENTTITECCFRQTARTGTPTSYRVGLQGVDGATGAPNESYLASGTFAPSAGAQNVCVSFTGQAVTRNTWYACVIQSESGVDGSNNIAVRRNWNNSLHATQLTPWDKDGAGSYGRQAGSLASCWYKSATKTYGNPSSTLEDSFVGSGNEHALRFSLPSSLCTTAEIDGIRVVGRLGGAVDYVLRLFSGSGVGDTTPSHTTTISRFLPPNNNGTHRLYSLYFSAPQTITCGSVYRIGYNQELAVKSFTAPTNADLEAYGANSTDWYTSTRSSGNWTDFNSRRSFIGLILKSITPAGSGGGGGIINLNNASGGAQ
jgi:hypothetical protein